MEVIGYCHNFDRYFAHNGRQTDRLEQILRHGILSPREAVKRGLPFQLNTHVRIEGARNYDNIIFLFNVNQQGPVMWQDAITIVLKRELEVLTPRQMIKYQGGNWIQLSHICGGEFYRFGSIPQNYFEEIIFPVDMSAKDAKELVRAHAPKLANKVKLSKPASAK